MLEGCVVRSPMIVKPMAIGLQVLKLCYLGKGGWFQTLLDSVDTMIIKLFPNTYICWSVLETESPECDGCILDSSALRPIIEISKE